MPFTCGSRVQTLHSSRKGPPEKGRSARAARDAPGSAPVSGGLDPIRSGDRGALSVWEPSELRWAGVSVVEIQTAARWQSPAMPAHYSWASSPEAGPSHGSTERSETEIAGDHPRVASSGDQPAGVFARAPQGCFRGPQDRVRAASPIGKGGPFQPGSSWPTGREDRV